MYKRPGEEGCVINRKHIRTTTKHGNSNTRPSGTDIVEFFFILMRRLKKDVTRDVGVRDGTFLSGLFIEGRSTTDPFGILENRCERSDIPFVVQLMLYCSKRSRD